MPRPSRCSAEYLEKVIEITSRESFAGFVLGPSTKDGRKTWKTIVMAESPLPDLRTPRGVPPVVVDSRGRKFGGNWSAVEAAAKINRADVKLPDAPEVAAFGFFDEW